VGDDDDSRRRPTTAALVVVVVLGLGLVAGTLLSGPLRAGRPLWLPTAGDGLPRRVLPGPFQTGSPAPLPAQQHLAPLQLQQWLLWAALAAVVVAGILVYLIRRALRRSRVLSAQRDGRASSVIAAAEPVRTDEPAAPVVARGIARAISLLDEAREPRDAIVRAWLGLQDAAEASGAGRRPSETPGEYTARIVTRFGTDREAARTLLVLYQGVRFGGHPVDDGTVQLARRCLTRLRDSWHDAATSAAGRGPGGEGAGASGRGTAGAS
jgi:hypothetical protein